MGRAPVVTAIFLVASLARSLGADAGPMVLFYEAPATYQANVTSNEALPIGNGKLAAMVYGGVPTETIQFNEETVWPGKRDRV